MLLQRAVFWCFCSFVSDVFRTLPMEPAHQPTCATFSLPTCAVLNPIVLLQWSKRCGVAFITFISLRIALSLIYVECWCFYSFTKSWWFSKSLVRFLRACLFLYVYMSARMHRVPNPVPNPVPNHSNSNMLPSELICLGVRLSSI